MQDSTAFSHRQLSVNRRGSSRPMYRTSTLFAWISALWLLSAGGVQAAIGHWDVCSSLVVRQSTLAICRTFQTRINAAHCVSQACAARVVRTDPRFTNPPWKVLDPHDHEMLIARLLRYSDNLFVSSPTLSRLAARLEARLFIAAGGKVWLWHDGWVTPILSYSPDPRIPPQPAPPGPQTIVDLHMPSPPGHPGWGWDKTYLMASNLTGPDPAVGQNIAVSLEGRVRLLLGNPYIAGRSDLGYPTMGGGFGTAAWFPKDMPGVYK